MLFVHSDKIKKTIKKIVKGYWQIKNNMVLYKHSKGTKKSLDKQKNFLKGRYFIMKKSIVINSKEINTKANSFHVLDDGKNGKAFELVIKSYTHSLNNKNGRNVSKSNETDLVKKVNGKKVKIEIKTRCGELTRYDNNGNVTTTVFDNDYIIYCPDTQAESLDIFVLTSVEFQMALMACNLIKHNKSRNKDNIQTFYNSKKRNAEWLNALNYYGTTIEEFVKENELMWG